MSDLKKILIVDDSRLVLSLHANILKKLGFECSTAENGAIALEACLNEQFDLILTDINMPKMDGYEFTKKVRAAKGYEDVPIIMISTEQEARDKTQGIEAGANVYIVKPVEATDLGMQIRMLLGE
jgi:two-component system, chemotaxis family, chemotaxis protein CheY